MKKFLSLLLVLFLMILPAACAETGIEPEQNASGMTAVSEEEGAADEDKEDHEDEDDDENEDEDEDEEDETPAGSSSALNFHGPLSAYVPARESSYALNWGEVVFENESDDEDEPEYEATYSGGALRKLEIEIELDDGEEYEVVFDGSRNILSAEYECDDGEITFDGTAWHDEDGNVVSGPDLEFMKRYYDDYELGGNWYYNNTMSLIGLPLQEIRPGLTDKWYQVVPVDLTREGVFRYPAAVSNMYWFGACIVTIRDGKVTVDYTLPDGYAYPESDCLMWFTGVDEITTEFLESPIGSYAFGEPVSIQDDLNGQEIALLFICNHITYRVPITDGGAMPARLWRGQESVQEILGEFETLLEKMQ